MQHREIFTTKYLREIGKHFDLQRDVPNLEAVRRHVANWQVSYHNGTIIRQSEIQLQKEFLHTFFVGCLGYRGKIGLHEWELDYEGTTETDSTRADGYLGFFTPESRKTIAVIELKDASTDLDRPQNRKNDKRTPVEQAFSYVPKVGAGCRWVIVSNFTEIRLYHAQDQGRYEYFHITQLDQDEHLWRFLFLLHRERMLPHGAESYLEHYHRQRLEQEQNISIDFYKKFKDYRQRLFQHLKAQNTEHPELILFEKTQKLLDRLVFVFFCEDKGLLPVDMTRKVKQAARASLDPAEGQGLWAQLKSLFRAIDKGNPAQNINRYNGGLFAHDPELDELRLDDSMAEVLLGLSNYDYDSDLNVNILGHIFEQSISDIEEIKAEIAGTPTEKKQGKRKKDGIFYTPEYITRYIVREAVGGWLDDRKRALGFEALPELTEADLRSIKRIEKGPRKGLVEGNAAVEKHRAAWAAYREVLADIKVLDPACGSGAFLIQVFDYLSTEGERVNDELARLSLGNRSTEDLSQNILTNNIFGVDINRESVEITKLALWLKTANNHQELSTLDHNIRCGNSLIDDPAVAGELAFDWKTEFAEIFEKKGGFDVVVGNPPYVFAREKIDAAEKNYYVKAYQSALYQVNTYLLFIERTTNLTNFGGRFGLIVPNAWLMVSSAKNLRELLLKRCRIDEIVNLSGYSFEGVNVETIILLAGLGSGTGSTITIKTSDKTEFVFLQNKSQDSFFDNAGFEFRVFADEDSNSITQKMLAGSLGVDEAAIVKAGLQAYEVGKGIPPQSIEDVKNRPYDFTYRFDSDTHPYLEGKDVERYSLSWSGTYLKYGDNLAAPRTFDLFSGQKLIIREITGRYPNSVIATYSNEVYLFNRSNIAVLKRQDYDYDLKYILTILNSSLMSYYFLKNTPKSVRQMFPKIILQDLRKFPIKKASPEQQSPFIAAADAMLALHRDLHAHKKRFLALAQAELGIGAVTRNLENWESLDFAGFLAELKKQKIDLPLSKKAEWLEHFGQERTRVLALQEQIRSTDRRIDDMVFDLYGLTAEERALVLGEGTGT